MPISLYSRLGPKVGKEFFQQLDEIIYDSGKIWVTFRSGPVSGPGIYSSGTRRFSRGQVVITKSRLICIVGGYKMVDVPKKHPLFKKLKMTKDTKFTVEFDMGQFPSSMKGKITLSFFIKDIKDYL